MLPRHCSYYRHVIVIVFEDDFNHSIILFFTDICENFFMVHEPHHTAENILLRPQWIEFIYELQHKICEVLEIVDGKAKFMEDDWERGEEGRGGGGITKIIQNGNVFEKGGVNISIVHGQLTEHICQVLKIPFTDDNATWFAGGISSVIHPCNPFVPTVHFNYRMFELYSNEGLLTDRWFGGGTDFTPYYLFEEDAKHFHQSYKNTCDAFDKDRYPAFKKTCDDYFVNTHRNNERRGIGGIFFDHQRPDDRHDATAWLNFARACGNTFIEAYLPIVEKRKNTTYNDHHKHWQEIRRGRYVEFNLIHDRGTLFGLKASGRTESILMSLPATARFEYNYQPEPGSDEDKLLQVCLNPKEWV